MRKSYKRKKPLDKFSNKSAIIGLPKSFLCQQLLSMVDCLSPFTVRNQLNFLNLPQYFLIDDNSRQINYEKSTIIMCAYFLKNSTCIIIVFAYSNDDRPHTLISQLFPVIVNIQKHNVDKIMSVYQQPVVPCITENEFRQIW